MSFDFSLYEPRKNRKHKIEDAMVEVTPKGRLVFNKKAADLLGQKHFCKLGFDKNEKAVGVLMLDEKDVNGFQIRYTTKGAYIGAMKFFKHFEALPVVIASGTPVVEGSYVGVKL